jgi:hypothetical protein
MNKWGYYFGMGIMVSATVILILVNSWSAYIETVDMGTCYAQYSAVRRFPK